MNDALFLFDRSFPPVSSYGGNGDAVPNAEITILTRGPVSIRNSFNSDQGQGFYEDSLRGIVVCGEITLYNRQEILSLLSHDHDCSLPDISLVPVLYRKFGKEFAKFLNGDFAFVVYDEANASVLCVRDQLGQRPFYYHLSKNYFVFSTKIHHLSIFSFSQAINDDVVLSLLKFYPSKADSTIFCGINRLPPGCVMELTSETVYVEKYWRPGDGRPEKADTAEEAVNVLTWHLEQAVRSRIDSGEKIGVELSGGLDSSAVAAFVTKSHGPESVSAFTNVLPPAYRNYFDRFSDEWSKAEQVTKALGIKNHYAVEAAPDPPIAMLEKSLGVIGQPANGAFSLLQRGIYHAAAAHKIDTLFSGFGGDEVVSQHVNGRYVASLIRHRKYFQLVDYFRKIEDSYLESISKAGFHLLGSLVGRRFRGLYRKPKAVEDVLLQPHLLERCSTDAQTEDSTDNVIPSEPLKERVLFHINRSSIAKRIETGYFMTGKFGLNYRYPLLDVKLIDYYYHLPDVWKVDHKLGRGMFRKALEGILPPNIIGQSKRNSFYTTATPFARIECQENFEPLKTWLLFLPTEHRIFDYVNRVQLQQLRYDQTPESYFTMKRLYNQLKVMAQLAMFFDKRANMKLYDI